MAKHAAALPSCWQFGNAAEAPSCLKTGGLGEGEAEILLLAASRLSYSGKGNGVDLRCPVRGAQILMN